MIMIKVKLRQNRNQTTLTIFFNVDNVSTEIEYKILYVLLHSLENFLQLTIQCLSV